MAAHVAVGTLRPFIATLHHDDELDETTKSTIAEIACDADFLLASCTMSAAPPTFTDPGLRLEQSRWAIVDSNHGPPPYESRALTN